MSLDVVVEARRQVEICNACRYCEGFCSVFPAITRDRAFSDGDITQLANLCHNCRGCYYSCQYTAPHEFALNLPQVLAEVRQDSWERLVWPQPLARAFQRAGAAIALFLAVTFSLLFYVLPHAVPSGPGAGFYAWIPHAALVAIFLPAFLFPLLSLGLGLRAYAREVGLAGVTLADVGAAFGSAARMRNLSGGHGEGCNFEREDRYSDRRRQFHQAVMYGFLLCFAATVVATLMHYGLGWHAPYGPFSLPKLLGVPGGLLLVVGCAGLLVLKRRADPTLGAPSVLSGEYAFVLLLGWAGLSGLALYLARGSGAVPLLLALHLGAVLAFFLLTPFSKMAHGFFRLAALTADARDRRRAG